MQKMVAKVGKPFCAILGSPVLGDVLNNTPDIFSVRWSRIVSRRRIAQKIARKLGKSFCAILGWPFSGDVLDLFGGPPKKTISNIQYPIYSTIEFKVIGIVYIVGYSIVG